MRRVGLPLAVRVKAVLLASVCLAAQAGTSPQQLKSGVELVLVDVQVVDRQGRPLENLVAGDFEVKIGGNVRRVASAELVRFDAGSVAPPGEPSGRPADGAAAVQRQSAGRNFIVAVDEASFHTRNAPAAVRAARRFIEHLSPADRVGLFTYPITPGSFELTTDHASIIKALDHVVGVLDVPIAQYQVSLAETVDIVAGDTSVLDRVSRRECPNEPARCHKLITMQAQSTVMHFETEVARSTAGLRTLFDALSRFPERKTVVVVSGGLVSSDRAGGRPDVSGVIATLGELAARSNTNLYVLHLDASFLDAFSAAGRSAVPSLMRDSSMLGAGLERLAGTAGGALVRVDAGNGDLAFDRVLRETSAYYLLGVEPLEADRDGQTHFISVRAKARGAEVRSRKTVVIPKRPAM